MEALMRRVFGTVALMTMLGSTAQAFELTSTDIATGQTMADRFTFNGMGCKGDNVSPALSWKDAPEGTKSFAIMVHDPDAPTGGAGIWHWVAYNIPASVMSLPQGAGTPDGSKMPAGSIQVSTDYLMPGYSGPCHPPGAAHSYNFTIYALKVDKLKLPPNATGSMAGYFINMYAIGSATVSPMK